MSAKKTPQRPPRRSKGAERGRVVCSLGIGFEFVNITLMLVGK